MKMFLLSSSIIICYFFSFSQSKKQFQSKPIIDTGMLKKWPVLGRGIVTSKDGRYIAFMIYNQPVNSKTIVIQDVESGQKQEIVGSEIGYNYFFSHDGKNLCWQNGDSLFLRSRHKNSSTLIGVVNFYIYPKHNKGEWVAFREKEKGNDLILLNLITRKRIIYRDCINATFDDRGTILLAQSTEKKSTLQWQDLEQLNSKIIWTGSKESKLTNFQFDTAGLQLAFIITEARASSVYYYKKGMTGAVKRLDNESGLVANGLSIGSINGFSNNGKWLFIKLKKPKQEMQKPDVNMVSVDVWSYKDVTLHSNQTSPNPFGYANTTVDLVMEMASENEGILLNSDGLKLTTTSGDYCILTSDTIESREYWWPHMPQAANWLVYLGDGSRRQLPKEFNRFGSFPNISPGGNWLTCWNEEDSSWMSYEIASGVIHNISNAVPAKLFSETEYRASINSHPVTYHFAGWYSNDSAIIIYDNYDIWKVDPACRKVPVNLTGEYGRNHKTELRIVFEVDELGKPKIYNNTEKLLISGFNQKTKYNGFFRLSLKRPGQLELLTMGPFTWFRTIGQGARPGGMLPVTIGNGKNIGYIVRRESATEFPNYYFTKNFKQFNRLTNFSPQKEYNWLTSELVNWTLPDGRKSQGVLYKPENFDATKKYPVIFNYYEKESHKLYDFPGTGLMAADIDIAWFVSREYLVFLPDIYYGNGCKTGISSGRYALNAVESAAAELCKLPYIDSTRLAINGHSFGGLETNYILTHSKMFAAAAEGAGFSDVMSSYLTLIGNIPRTIDIESTQAHKEKGHELYGATPWECPEIYLDNSPVWAADKASAPLLIFHNKVDNQVQWRQGVEMYMALRRLGKACWMLQYDNESHVLNDEKSTLDYSIRITQFFDHYLKLQPAPRWMTQGVPAKLKQIENRYELDPSGICAKECKVCTSFQKKQ